MSRRSVGNKLQLQYQVFLDFTDYCIDEYWLNLFTDFAHGKFPKWLTFEGGILTCRKKKKGEAEPASFKLYPSVSNRLVESPEEEKDDLGDLYLRTREFLEREGGIKSDADMLKVTEERNLPSEWKDVKNPRQKQLLLYQFCEGEVKKRHLPSSHLDFLQALMSLGLLYKIINSSTVSMREGKVVEVSVLKWDGSRFSLDVSSVKRGKQALRKVQKVTRKSPWKDFVDGVETQVQCVRKQLKE